MNQKELQLINQAQAGELSSKEELIELYTSYVYNITSNYCNRRLEWENDEELSIALLALNEAIEKFDPTANKKFKNYLRMVIKSRLIDYFRKESKHNYLTLQKTSDHDKETDDDTLQDQAAIEKYQQQIEVQERAEEMKQFEEMLNDFGMSFQELEQTSPSHQKTRDKLIEIAQYIADHREFLQYLLERRQLPLKQLAMATGYSKKVLKRGRKYIIAVTLIITDERFTYLRSLFSLSSENFSSSERGWQYDKN